MSTSSISSLGSYAADAYNVRAYSNAYNQSANESATVKRVDKTTSPTNDSSADSASSRSSRSLRGAEDTSVSDLSSNSDDVRRLSGSAANHSISSDVEGSDKQAGTLINVYA